MYDAIQGLTVDTHQASRVSFRWDGTKMVIRHIDHDSAAGCIGSACPDSSISCVCLVWPVFVLDSLNGLLVGRILQSLLCHANGCGKGCVDPGVHCKLGWEGVTARGACFLALCNPLLEASQAEVVLTGSLYHRCCCCSGTKHLLQFDFCQASTAKLASLGASLLTYRDRSSTKLHAHGTFQAVVKHGWLNRACLSFTLFV